MRHRSPEGELIMGRTSRTAMLTLTVSLAAAAVAAAPAGAAQAKPEPRGGYRVVFVQTDNTSGNRIVAYDRRTDGTLSIAQSYATGGLGGVLTGAVVDHLASQGSL